MSSLYNNYCYPDAISAANAEISSSFNVGASAIVSASSYNDVMSQMTYQVTPLDGTPAYNLLHLRSYVACSSVGPVSSNLGVSLLDASIVSWLVVIVWATAYYFKALRIGVRGY